MSSQALYQKYRSQTFEEVVGQEYVVRAIKNAVREGKVGHAYLFCGPRGTGKTTMARLLAKAINCTDKEHAPCGKCESCKAATQGRHPDIIEMNAANTTGVDDIRAIIEKAQMVPMMSPHKVYIIDEVHQLSSSASSALLKTLEEPPSHVVFILATTDPQKMLKTIISRCQRFDFSKVETEKIKAHLLTVAEKEDIQLETDAAEKIARLADGGMRDALSILEQANAYALGNITAEAVDAMYGLTSMNEKIGYLEDICHLNLESLLKRIEDNESHGVSLERLTMDLVMILKDGLIYSYTKKETLLQALTQSQAQQLQKLVTDSQKMALIDLLLKAKERYKFTQSPRAVFEVACMEMMAALQPETIAKPDVKTVDNRTLEEEKRAKEEKPARESIEEKHYDTEDIVSLLVQCDKTNKQTDEPVFESIVKGGVTDKYAAALKQCQLVASGNDCLVFMCSMHANARMMNNLPFNEELYHYLKIRGIDKMPFTFAKEDIESAIKRFKQQMSENSLPAAKVIQRYQPVVNKESESSSETPEERVMTLFGKENVEVVE